MAVFVHLDDTDQSNGGLGVFPGSHLQGPQVEKREKNSSRNQQILLYFLSCDLVNLDIDRVRMDMASL